MNKEYLAKPGLVGTIFLTFLVGIIMKNGWDLYTPTLGIQGSQRLMGERLDLRFAIGSEKLISEVAPWINDDQIERTRIGPLEIAGRLVVDERLNIRDRIEIQSALK